MLPGLIPLIFMCPFLLCPLLADAWVHCFSIDWAHLNHGRHSGNGQSGGYSQYAPVYQPPPISNYKGVMLCDRPTTKFGAKTSGDSQAQMPFSCAIGPGSKYESLGLNPSKEQRAIKMATEGKTRPRDNNDYMTRHKQWLSGLNKQRQVKALEDDAAVQNAIEKTKRFREYAAKLRANIRNEKEHPSENLTESAVNNLTKESSEPSNSKKSKKVLNSRLLFDK
jgi:hypothetical protein